MQIEKHIERKFGINQDKKKDIMKEKATMKANIGRALYFTSYFHFEN
jgi:hypothetical protein